MRTPLWIARWFLPVLAAAALLLSSLALAQYDVRPFEDDPLGALAGFAAESSVLRLEGALVLLEQDVEVEELEELLEGLGLEFVRFAGTLAQQDEELLERAEVAFEELDETLEEAEESGETGELREQLEATLEVAREVRARLSEARWGEPEFTAAVMSLLLTTEAGVAEGWEEAFEGEVGPYAFAHAGMPRLMEMWEQLKPLADDNQVFEVEDQLAEMQALFATPLPPSMQGQDPEAAEDPAVRAAGFLEDITGAWLFPDRDQAALMRNVHEHATLACSEFSADNPRQATSHLTWVGFAYGEYLQGTLNLFAPEATATLDELLASYMNEAEEEEDEEGEREGGEAEEGDEEDDELSEGVEPFDPNDCQRLLDALTTAGAPFGL